MKTAQDKKERKFDDGHEPASYIGSKIELGGLTSLLALHVLKTPEMHTYP